MGVGGKGDGGGGKGDLRRNTRPPLIAPANGHRWARGEADHRVRGTVDIPFPRFFSYDSKRSRRLLITFLFLSGLLINFVFVAEMFFSTISS